MSSVWGAKVVVHGSRVLKDAQCSLFTMVANIDDSTIFFGSLPLRTPIFPEIVRDFQSVIGREAKQQYRDLTGQDGQMPQCSKLVVVLRYRSLPSICGR